MVRRSSWVRFYLRRHVQAVEGDKTVSLLVNAKTGNAPAEYHTPLPPTCLGRRCLGAQAGFRLTCRPGDRGNTATYNIY